MHIAAGTSGYSYKEWKGAFYPEDVPASGFLAHYATRLPVVEINNTFYRMPRADMLEKWRDQVPESFRFVLKASRRITHIKRLKDAGEECAYLYETASATLGDRLGAFLFQLPPYSKKDIERLTSFLDALPDPSLAALEFRNDSWFDEETYACMRAKGVALCTADTDDDLRDTPIVSTADWGYLRLRRESYDDAALERWVRAIKSQSWSKAFVFFKHEDDAAGPLMAERFLTLAR